ncbi:hypothetical protein VD659_16170 [Herbiconiux sp. 11R-BC]|uniref:hypothetical protein n=1 Tax=Herbiconiux sp. 11R-BC TaxID=3111637 RepID=UPI003BFB9977
MSGREEAIVAYVLTDYQEVTRPLVGIFQLRDGWEAHQIIGVGVFRDMHPDARGSENVPAPVFAMDLTDGGAWIHDYKTEVAESHLPQYVVQDAELYEAVWLGAVPVDMDDTGRWFVIGGDSE